MTTTTARRSTLDVLRDRFPEGTGVAAVHLGTRRPRSGTAESDVAILAISEDGQVIVNVSALVGRLTGDPIVTTKTDQRALRILGRPTNPTKAAVESLSFTLHGRTDALFASGLI